MTTQEKPNVLVVEDEPLISDMIAQGLEDEGFRVHAVPNAEQALRHLASHGDVDVLFTDINLPGGMDGSTLARWARELNPALSVVYASGRVSSLDRFSAVPGSIFVPKPYTPAQICRVLTELAAAA
jgi:CheY-like chemotaxis protein